MSRKLEIRPKKKRIRQIRKLKLPTRRQFRILIRLPISLLLIRRNMLTSKKQKRKRLTKRPIPKGKLMTLKLRVRRRKQMNKSRRLLKLLPLM